MYDTITRYGKEDDIFSLLTSTDNKYCSPPKLRKIFSELQELYGYISALNNAKLFSFYYTRNLYPHYYDIIIIMK